jgi:hypothetical protein
MAPIIWPFTTIGIPTSSGVTHSWAKLIARVHETDPLQCGHCAGRMKTIAFVGQASEIRQILAQVGLPPESPKVHSARGPPQSVLWEDATASEWEIKATHPDAADQDKSLY